MAYKKLYAKRILTKEQFLTILKIFLKKLPKKLFLLKEEYQKRLSSAYNGEEYYTDGLTKRRLFLLSMLMAHLKISFSNKSPFIQLAVDRYAVMFTVRLIRTYIQCKNFHSFYGRQTNEFLGELIYNIQSHVYVHFNLAYFDHHSPLIRESIIDALFSREVNEKNLTSAAYMKIMLKYANRKKKRKKFDSTLVFYDSSKFNK
jgi:hypothetical protein